MGLELPLSDPILQFLLLASAALVVQLTLERLHVPGLVGLLIVGVVVGPDGFAVLPREPVVGLLGSIGLLYIMFLAGLEVDLDVVRAHKREAIGFGLAAFSVSLVLAVGVGLLMGYGPSGALLLGAALSSHTLSAYPIIERLGLFRERPIVATIGGTLLTDTLALVLLVIVVEASGGSGTGWLVPIGLLIVVMGIILASVPYLGRWFLRKSRARPAEKALFLLVVLLVAASAADLVGTEDILGAFVAGVALNRLVRRRDELHEHLEFVGRMLFIPFFFVETGMRLDPGVLAGRADVWFLAATLLAVVVVGKSTAAWAMGATFGYDRVSRITMGALALPQAAATLAVVVTAREEGLLNVEVVDAVIIVIFVTSLVGPIVTRTAGRRMAEGSDGSPEMGRRDP